MTIFKMIGGACLAAALAAASPAMADGHVAKHRGYHHHGFARSVFAAAAIDGFTYYGGYTPRGEDYPYYYDAGYVPEPNYFSNSQFACQPGTIFFGEDRQRHLCE
jgi:hypothetical protein